MNASVILFQSATRLTVRACRGGSRQRPVRLVGAGKSIRAGRIARLLLLGLSLTVACRGQDGRKSFGSPEEAVATLGSAVTAMDTNSLRAIFGPAGKELQNPDRTQAANDFKVFAEALSRTNRLVRESDTKYVLEIGTNLWPFPVPLVQGTEGWIFDTESGKDEVLSRRIGRNELEALQVMRAYVEAQREYAGSDHDGDGVLKYAQRLVSTPGKEDGLYWPESSGQKTSPLGPLVAYAQGEGYALGAETNKPAPFYGYYFKILTRQGRHAPGRQYDYIVNGNMIGGFAMVAWPAVYGESGIMTFIVNQQGRVFQKDLGKETVGIARKMRVYDPDSTWRESAE